MNKRHAAISTMMACLAVFLFAVGAFGADAFPVTVQHKYGSTTVSAPPKRVVSLGYKDQDDILALGVKPIAIRYWFGEEPYGVYPWAQDALGEATPVLLNMPEIDIEAIAALQPDLIIAVYSGITQEVYANLSRIAPTLAPSGAYIDFGMPWQESMRHIGRALGREGLAEELVAETEARFAAAREKYPEFVGAKMIMASMRPNGSVALYTEQDGRTRVLTSLGFDIPDEIESLFGDRFYTEISPEQMRLLDTADVVVWNQMVWYDGAPADIEANPFYSRLNVARSKRHVFVEGYADYALQFGTVLSLRYLLDGLIPAVAAAMDGDPATVARVQ